MEKINISFDDKIAETLLIPLWMRATESKRTDALLHDKASESIVAQIEYDFEKFSADKRSMVGVALRTRYLDKVVENFINSHTNPVVVLGGCGLDPRMSRVNAMHSYTCYEIDLPEVIAYRQKLIPDTENDICIAESLFSTNWMDKLKEKHRNASFLFVAEGVFMYMEENVVKQFVDNIANRFPHSELYFERMGSTMVKNTKHHTSVKQTKACFAWGCDNPQEVAAWNASVKLKNEYYFMKDAPKRVGFLGLLAKHLFWHSCGIWGYNIQ